jgi:hydrogenase maturation protein HypF
MHHPEPLPAFNTLASQAPGAYVLSLQGIVQGVGFRPWVYRMAQARGLKGQVTNGTAGVRIVLESSKAAAEAFLADLLADLPTRAVVTEAHLQPCAPQGFTTFRIEESERDEKGSSLVLTPDLALCKPCLAELNNPKNRRYRYPFISCTDCGPRYSILEALPFDRHTTAMRLFDPCPACLGEYTDPSDRRFHAQVNACSHCGPALSWWDAHSNAVHEKDNEATLAAAVEALKNGQIVAVKGIGGYLLMCDATRAETVARLRQRKQRPSKPFALLCADLALARQYAYISAEEAEMMESPLMPIVLLEGKQPAERPLCPEVAPGLHHTGIMLPCAPLLYLLAEACYFPLVATSANISGSPIIHTEEAAVENLGHVADYFLVHDRPITMPQDDSVVQYLPTARQWLIHRRGRGMTLDLQQQIAPQDAWAFGADLKATFALQTKKNLYVSQFLGDLASFDAQEHFQRVKNRFAGFFQGTGQKPGYILADWHEDFYATGMARAASRQWGVPLTRVQHHFAHFAAVLAENGLLEEASEVLGVIWDGTGLGTDGHIWGGEFFWQETRMHLPYFPHVWGDQMAKVPGVAACCLAATFGLETDALRLLFTDHVWQNLQAAIAKSQRFTSSIGRLFDGVAALLGICHTQSYEGEAAMKLEAAARKAIALHGMPEPLPFQGTDLAPCLQALQRARNTGHDPEVLAARFHLFLVELIGQKARETGARKIAFSGGVFQNALLTALCIKALGAHYSLYFHRQLPPNDENIAYGQLAASSIHSPLKEKYYVPGNTW